MQITVSLFISTMNATKTWKTMRNKKTSCSLRKTLYQALVKINYGQISIQISILAKLDMQENMTWVLVSLCNGKCAKVCQMHNDLENIDSLNLCCNILETTDHVIGFPKVKWSTRWTLTAIHPVYYGSWMIY